MTFTRLKYHGPAWQLEVDDDRGTFEFTLYAPRPARPDIERPAREGWLAFSEFTTHGDDEPCLVGSPVHEAASPEIAMRFGFDAMTDPGYLEEVKETFRVAVLFEMLRPTEWL